MAAVVGKEHVKLPYVCEGIAVVAITSAIRGGATPVLASIHANSIHVLFRATGNPTSNTVDVALVISAHGGQIQYKTSLATAIAADGLTYQFRYAGAIGDTFQVLVKDTNPLTGTDTIDAFIWAAARS